MIKILLVTLVIDFLILFFMFRHYLRKAKLQKVLHSEDIDS